MHIRKLFLPTIFFFLSVLFWMKLTLGTTMYSLDSDEIYSEVVAQCTIKKILTGVCYDPGNPPLHFIFLKAWRLMGTNEGWVRIPSALFLLATGILITIMLWPTGHPYASLLFFLMFTSNHLLLSLGRYARGYTCFLFLGVLTLFLFVKNLSRPRPSWHITFVTILIATIGLYTHYSFAVFFVLLVLSLFLVIKPQQRKHLIRIVIAVGILYSPWAIFFIRNQFIPAGYGYTYSFHQLGSPWPGMQGWLDIMTNTLFGQYVPYHVQPVIAGVIWFFFLGICCIAIKKSNVFLEKIVHTLTVLSVITLFVTPLHRVFTQPKYSVYIVVCVLLSLTFLIKRLYDKQKMLGCIAGLALVTITFTPYIQDIQEDWKSLAHALPSYPTDADIALEPCFQAFAFTFYYQGNMSRYCFSPNTAYPYLPIWNNPEAKILYLVTSNDRRSEDVKQKLKTLDATRQKTEQKFGRLKLVIYTKK